MDAAQKHEQTAGSETKNTVSLCDGGPCIARRVPRASRQPLIFILLTVTRTEAQFRAVILGMNAKWGLWL